MKAKQKAKVWKWIKWLSAFLSYLYIGYRLAYFEQWSAFGESFYGLSAYDYGALVLVLLLMPVNWALESYKWQYLLRKLHSVSFAEAIKAVLSGVSLGVYTPARVGELAGRIFYLPKAKRKQGLLAAMLSSYAQSLTTLLMGAVGLIYFSIQYSPDTWQMNTSVLQFVPFVVFLLLFFAFLFYYRLSFFSDRLQQVAWLNKHHTAICYLSGLQVGELSVVLLLSISRYLIFASQFYLLLLFFQVDISPSEAFIGLSFSYFSLLFIPAMSLAEISIRSSLSIFFLSTFSNNAAGIFLSTSILWMINVALVALIGSYFWLVRPMKN